MSTRAQVFITALICAAAACAGKHSPPDPRCMDEADLVIANVSPNDDDANLPNPSNDPPLGGICDGSDELRLVVASNLGPGAIAAFAWQDYYARPFLLIDGRCHFYAAGLELGPVTQGQLTATMLEQLTADLAVEELANLPSRRDDCADHWSDRLIATQEHTLRCRCDDCGEGTRSTIAIQNAVMWIDKLVAEGTPLTGVLSAIAMPREPVVNSVVRRQTVDDWPLETAVHNISGLLSDHWGPIAGTHFSGEDAAALRELRAKTAGVELSAEIPGLTPYFVFVRDCGETYALSLRDELPARIQTQLVELLKVAWTRPIIPSCVDFNSRGASLMPCPL